MMAIKRGNCVKQIVTIVLSCGILASPASSQPPETPVRIVKEDFFGRQIEDPYRWLENIRDPEVLKWLKLQNDHTRSVLDKIPGRVNILARIREVDTTLPPPLVDPAVDNKGRLFYFRNNSAGIAIGYMLDPSTGGERVVLDPEKLAGPGKPPLRVSGISPSPDGRYIAFRARGSARSSVHILDVRTGMPADKPIENVLGFTGLDWDIDSKSIFVVKLPPPSLDAKPSEAFLNAAAYRHAIGTKQSTDQLLVSSGEDRDLKLSGTSWPFVFALPNKKHLAVWIEDGVRPGHALYIANRADALANRVKWRRLSDFENGATHATFHGNDAFLLVPGETDGRSQIWRLNVDREDISTSRKIDLPAKESVITSMEAADDAVYATATEGLSSAFYRIPYQGEPVKVEPPLAGAVKPFLVVPSLPGGLFRITSWTRPSDLYRYDPGRGWRLAVDLQASSDLGGRLDLVARTVNVSSHDNVEVPLTIVHRRGLKLDSTNPTYITGYGSYGSESLEPVFENVFVPWFEAGGVYAIAHVRGGGELGDAWHKAGSKDKKPNTWRDFIACAEYLISRRYTSPDRLAGGGVSAGGILIGRAITERPDLFRAALISVGTTDMLRAEYQMNGPANVVEFGTVKEKTSFEQLLEMSTYHHVRDGVKYPAVLVSTGMRDTNVDVWQPAKIAARFQAAMKTHDRPVLLRIDPEGGHDQYGSTRGQVRELRADQFAFLLWQLGLLQSVRSH